jgi:CHAD domain-containing protein
MPYRFKINEPVEKGFRRIAREQLDAALAELAAQQIAPSGVHECRKALKRLRALVRLASPALGQAKARQRAKALGEIARLLSARRDQAVMLETVAKLASEGGPDAAHILAPLRAHLVASVGEQPKPLDGDSAAKARMLLLQEAKKFSRARFKKRGFAALEGGLETSYRQARKALKNAYGEPSDEAFHSLRKAVQWHWRQMSLLARAWPDEFAVRVAAARELSQLLGDDHDLAMLIGATATAEKLTSDEKETIVALCHGQQHALRAAAEFRVGRLFAEGPKAFIKRMRAYWDFARAGSPRLETTSVAHPAPPALPPRTVNGEAQGAVEPAPEAPKPAAAKPRLAAKSVSSAPSQRRA